MKSIFCYIQLGKVSLVTVVMTLIVSFALTACPSSHDYEIHIDKEKLYIPFDSDRGYVKIITDGQWYVSQVDPQISLSPWKGSGESVMTVYKDELNGANEDHLCVITIKSVENSDCTATIYVYLEGSHENTN